MRKEKSRVQKLKDFAKKTGRQIEFVEQVYPSHALQSITYQLRKLYIANNKGEKIFFVCYDDSRRMGRHALYSGVFFPISVHKSTKVVIRKRYFFNNLGFLSKKRGYATGTASFDSQVVFEEFDAVRECKFIADRKVQYTIEKALQFDFRLRIAINGLRLDFVPELKGQSHFGIYVSQDWFVDSEKIETLFNLGEEIQRFVITAQEPILQA